MLDVLFVVLTLKSSFVGIVSNTYAILNSIPPQVSISDLEIAADMAASILSEGGSSDHESSVSGAAFNSCLTYKKKIKAIFLLYGPLNR